MNLTHVPLRVATGAFILNSGLTKLKADDEAAEGLHGFAATAYPTVETVPPKTFARLLGAGEIALGGALLAPMVPSVVAGAGLTGFGIGLMGLYARTPGLRQEGSIRPTEQGVPIAKDAWLVGAGATMTLQGIFGSARKAGKKAKKKVSSATESAHDALPF
ncbi:DoxX family membrane protein [Nocardioides panacisoli]|uniref:DoxX family membrane protein n=1 Tax=Nocardioides panacisoli TaxID=627624 RepID=UPI001C62E1F5|nr:DoxX family membrane protein [Nocardioides panacisoli]QYJ05093.1 DoxX family membrane protein [Nocardioides panacisoli]